MYDYHNERRWVAERNHVNYNLPKNMSGNEKIINWYAVERLLNDAVCAVTESGVVTPELYIQLYDLYWSM
jgi:hypothetical protein